MNSHESGTSSLRPLGGMNILIRPGRFSLRSQLLPPLLMNIDDARQGGERRAGQLGAVIQQRLRLNQPSGAFREHNVLSLPPKKSSVQDELRHG